jgi:CBS domain-containing protein
MKREGERSPQQPIGRRQFLALVLPALLAPFVVTSARSRAEASTRTRVYVVDVSMLHGVFGLHLDGVLTEVVDSTEGRYHVTAEGRGDGIVSRVDSRGLLLNGRWAPSESHSDFNVLGRHSFSDIVYDWGRRTVNYDFRGETFFLRRVRIAHDVLTVSGSMRLDDAVSAMLNYREGRWPPEPDGSFLTLVVRRKRQENEQPEDAQDGYRAELAPFSFRVAVDPKSGERTARFDLGRFSSWARPDRPATVTFGADGNPERMTMEMILGTSVRLGFAGLGG